MDVISFDISGKFAHFRKFYGNNTALSYSTPPRTTVLGMIAAMLGEERGQYHDEFRHPNLYIGVRLLTNVKKAIHRVNLLNIKSSGDFGGKNGRMQTPFEVVSAYNPRKEEVSYRIFVGEGENKQLFERIRECLNHRTYKFSLSLGPANFLASVRGLQKYKEVTRMKPTQNWTEIHSVCNSDNVSDITFRKDGPFTLAQIEEELMPADFVANNNREVYRMNRILVSTSSDPLQVKLNAPYYKLYGTDNTTQFIQFLEYTGLLAQQEER